MKLSVVGLALLLVIFTASVAQAAPAPAPAWRLTSVAAPTNFTPGDTKNSYYQVEATNVGGAPTDGSPIVLTDVLPKGLTVKDVELLRKSKGIFPDLGPSACVTQTVAEVATVTCTVTEATPGAFEPARVYPSERFTLIIRVAVPVSLSGSLVNEASVAGGGAPGASNQKQNQADSDPAPPGFAEFAMETLGPDGKPMLEAGSHPFTLTTRFAANTELAPEGSAAPLLGAGGDLKDIRVALPPGLVGNPTAATKCAAKQFVAIETQIVEGTTYYQTDCPPSSAVGVIAIGQIEGLANQPRLGPVYNLVPPPGMPAQFGFQVAGFPIYIDTEVRSDSDFGVNAVLRNASQAKRITSAAVTLWGNPADSLHDRLRGACAEAGGECPGGVVDPKPFLRLPTSCALSLTAAMTLDTWLSPGERHSALWTEPAPTNCEVPPFDPSIVVQPTSQVADSPTGLDVDLHIPQNEEPEGISEADLRDVTVTLPEGLVVNPASAGGLTSCSAAEIGLLTPAGAAPPRFSKQPAACPNASKVGAVEVETPLLENPLKGGVFLAKQQENPFGSLIAIYVAVEDPLTGIVVKLAGEVTPDPVTGRLTTTFTNNPQLPFEDFKLDFFSGPRASLRTPASCGNYQTTTQLTPHTAPASSPPATPSSAFDISTGPAGGCPTGALAAHFSAGLTDATAGSYSPFVMRLTRADATGIFSALTVTPPQGLLAKLVGIPYCSDAAIAAASARTAPGQGAAEVSSPSCPAASRVGSTTAGVGAGPNPFYTGGSLYLAGPYKGAPISLAAVIPAVAGPFDLGVVVTRIALHVESETARVSAVSDPLPTIISGIPLDIRDVRVALDRPNFTLAPTSCAPKNVEATAFGTSGATLTLSQHFQASGCHKLGFGPKLRLKLRGGTKRGDYPALRAELRARKGDANIGKTSVALPHSEFLAQEHIVTICTRVQFAADQCPKGSVYGKARAFSPLLDEPLEGPVYLRSSANPLPDLVAAMDGQIEIDLVGKIDSVNEGIRTTFSTVPDAPVTKFVLAMRGGNKSLLTNSTNICRGVHRATVRMTAQNGKSRNFRPSLKASGCRKKPKKR